MLKKNLLVIFVRNPELGKVKTRLASSIGEEAALYVYRQLIHCTQVNTQHIPADKFVYYDSYIPENDTWDDSIYAKHFQQGNDLGERMQNAFNDGFKQGYTSIVIIGSDCAGLSGKMVTKAFDALQENDFVIGPASDGGYYLLGMRSFYPELFLNKMWSTDTVYQDTLRDISFKNASVHILPKLTDIDTEEDLREMIRLRLL
jgi:rSAM/selenodomain-associated transferase 1